MKNPRDFSIRLPNWSKSYGLPPKCCKVLSYLFIKFISLLMYLGASGLKNENKAKSDA